MFELLHFQTAAGRDPVTEWLRELADRAAKIAIMRRLNRIMLGNFGDHKTCGRGVSELRIDWGPGYRVYYARAGSSTILLLCGGNKSTQSADIERACGYWREWQSRKQHEESAP